MSYQEAMAAASKLRYSIKIQNEIGFGDMHIKAPDIDVFPDKTSYFDPNAHCIHLGVHGIVDMFRCKAEPEFIGALNYVRGHEEQHCRSTASTPYSWGISRGMELVLEYIANKVEASKKRFRNSRDFKEYANRELPAKGIYLSYSMLRDLVSGIANSIEDGRIERIRASRFPGFEKQRMLYRGIFWRYSATEYKKYSDVEKDATEKLRLILNAILTLATCQLYPRGFVAKYGDTPLMDELKPLMPHIAKGVMADRTREMAVEVTKVVELLAPMLYEVCKMNKSQVEMKKALEKLLAELIKASVDNSFENGSLSERDEDTGDGSPNSTFPHSDLVITLDDETYDKLEKNARKGDGSGLMIRREHPKPESEKEKSEEEQKEGNGNNGQGDKNAEDANGKNSDGGGNNGPETEKEHSPDGKSADDPNKEPSNGSSKDNSSSKSRESDGHNSSGENKTVPQNSTDEMITGDNEDPTNGHTPDDEKAILDAMRNAANEVYAAAKKSIDNANTSDAQESKARVREVPDKYKPITPESVKDICPMFKEFKRQYKLKDPLPPVIAARGRALLRKNQQYFKSLSTPNVSHLDQGSVDPSRIYGLALGDTEIFRKKGTDKKFDGCVYMLIDNSGSMAGNKRVEACKAAAVIEESFRGLIPIKIVAFDYGHSVIHEVIKGWDEQMRFNGCWNFCLHGRQGDGNADGYDILIAARELMSRPERKKLMLVLSDGMPAEASAGFTKGAIEQARKQGIQVTGIYFDEGGVGYAADQFKDMYGNGKDAIVCALDELDNIVWQQMKAFSRS